MKKENIEADLENEIETETLQKDREFEELKENIEDLNQKLLRTMAETENMRKRYEKQIEDTRDYSIVSFAKDLISVIDNLERAIKFIPENPSDDLKSVIDGVIMTHKQLESVLRLHGVVAVVPIAGEKFNYNLHHAISFVESNEIQNEHIVDLMQVGYKIKDRLLRPAGVSVAKNKEAE